MSFDDNMRESVGHPTDAALRTYWTRMLNPDETYAIGQHLASCEDCRMRAQQLPEVKASVNWLQADQRLEAGAGHLSYEIAVEIAGGTPPPEEVQLHLERCPSCRADVDDLRSFRDELARVPEARQVTPRLMRPTAFYQRRQWQIAAALLLAVGLGVYVWKARQPTETTLKIKLNDDGGTVAMDDKGRLLTPHPYPQEYAGAVSRAAETGTLDIPAGYTGIRRPEQLLGPGDSHATIELDSPVGVAVESTTPIFRWQALPNATRYRVAVYGRGYQEVMTSGDLTGTEWTPVEQLARDASYAWTVTARVAGKSVLAPVPPAPEARFRVISSSEADAIVQTRRDFPDAHLLLGLLYARMGLAPESKHELEALQKANPDSGLAKKLLAQIQDQKPSPINTKPAQ
jgi:hypothetical protein